MPRYEVEFTETVTYKVTFDSDRRIKELRENEDTWFEEMDQDQPNWFKQGLMAVTERDLQSIRRVRAKKKPRRKV